MRADDLLKQSHVRQFLFDLSVEKLLLSLGQAKAYWPGGHSRSGGDAARNDLNELERAGLIRRAEGFVLWPPPPPAVDSEAKPPGHFLAAEWERLPIAAKQEALRGSEPIWTWVDPSLSEARGRGSLDRLIPQEPRPVDFVRAAHDYAHRALPGATLWRQRLYLATEQSYARLCHATEHTDAWLPFSSARGGGHPSGGHPSGGHPSGYRQADWEHAVERLREEHARYAERAKRRGQNLCVQLDGDEVLAYLRGYSAPRLYLAALGGKRTEPGDGPDGRGPPAYSRVGQNSLPDYGIIRPQDEYREWRIAVYYAAAPGAEELHALHGHFTASYMKDGCIGYTLR